MMLTYYEFLTSEHGNFVKISRIFVQFVLPINDSLRNFHSESPVK